MSSPPLNGSPPANGGENGADAGQAPANTNGAAMSPPVGSMDASAAPPNLGTFAGDLSDAELQPRYTQADLADGAVIRGTISCDSCTGQLLVRVLPPPPDNPAAATDDSLQLITQAPFTSIGDFEIRVPSGEPVILQVVDDANMDGFPSQGERMGMREEGPVISEGEFDGVVLTVGVFPAMADITPTAVPTPGDMPTPGDAPTPGDVPTPGDMPTPEEGPPAGPDAGMDAAAPMPDGGSAPPANDGGGPPTDDAGGPPTDDASGPPVDDAGGPPADDG